MDIFCKGFDPPPTLIFGSYGTGGAHWRKKAGTWSVITQKVAKWHRMANDGQN